MLSSIATLLGAAKRRPTEVAVVVVQKSDACIDLSVRSQNLLLVASVGVCHKAIFGFVGDGDGFFLGLEGCDRDDRPKHLLHDPHVAGDVENCWLDEESVLASRIRRQVSLGRNLSTCIFADFDIIEDALLLLLGHA